MALDLIDKYNIVSIKTENVLHLSDSCDLRQFSFINTLRILNIQCTLKGYGWRDLSNVPNLEILQSYYSTFMDDISIFSNFTSLKKLQLGYSVGNIDDLLSSLSNKRSGTFYFSYNDGKVNYQNTMLRSGVIHTFNLNGDGTFSKEE